MRKQLMLHCGGTEATLNDLMAVPLPDETRTYKPVSHYDLAMNISRVAEGMLDKHTFGKGMYALSTDGRRMFGVHAYRNEVEDMGLSIGFRNSYDKTMSVGIVIGATIFVCDNLAFTGQVTILRKHTLNVIDDLETAIIKVIYKSKFHFTSLVRSAEEMKTKPLLNEDAFKLMGLLFGRQVLTPRQLVIAKQEWVNPSYETFFPRTYWSFYNAVTGALKSTPVNHIMERHIKLHDTMLEELSELTP